MKLHVLGSNSSGNGYILISNSQILIIECGCPLMMLKKTLKFDLSKIVGSIVSHAHGDHSKYITEYMKSGIPVFSLKEVGSNRTVEAGQTFNIGEFKIIAFDVHHDVPCLGFLINHPEMGTLLFATDTSFLSKRFTELNHILIECNYKQEILNDNLWNGVINNLRFERTKRTHMSLEICIDTLNANDLTAVQNIVLIHLSPQNSDAELFKNKVMETTGKPVFIARKDLVIDLNRNPY